MGDQGRGGEDVAVGVEDGGLLDGGVGGVVVVVEPVVLVLEEEGGLF